jgi:hypothetical protein
MMSRSRWHARCKNAVGTQPAVKNDWPADSDRLWVPQVSSRRPIKLNYVECPSAAVLSFLRCGVCSGLAFEWNVCVGERATENDGHIVKSDRHGEISICFWWYVNRRLCLLRNNHSFYLPFASNSLALLWKCRWFVVRLTSIILTIRGSSSH